MAFPRTNHPYMLYTDASDFACGAILCQYDDTGLERVIQYVSHQLSGAQLRWATIEKEAYAVVYALKKLRPYLLGSDFIIYTYHKPLVSLFISKIENAKIQRWAITCLSTAPRFATNQARITFVRTCCLAFASRPPLRPSTRWTGWMPSASPATC
jgi:hypothetical protein